MRHCEVCQLPYQNGCTNNRCPPCHRKHCTPGGNTSPGHGRGTAHLDPHPDQHQQNRKTTA